jgi:hypothetical protein
MCERDDDDDVSRRSRSARVNTRVNTFKHRHHELVSLRLFQVATKDRSEPSFHIERRVSPVLRLCEPERVRIRHCPPTRPGEFLERKRVDGRRHRRWTDSSARQSAAEKIVHSPAICFMDDICESLFQRNQCTALAAPLLQRPTYMPDQFLRSNPEKIVNLVGNPRDYQRRRRNHSDDTLFLMFVARVSLKIM